MTAALFHEAVMNLLQCWYAPAHKTLQRRDDAFTAHFSFQQTELCQQPLAVDTAAGVMNKATVAVLRSFPLT